MSLSFSTFLFLSSFGPMSHPLYSEDWVQAWYSVRSYWTYASSIWVFYTALFYCIQPFPSSLFSRSVGLSLTVLVSSWLSCRWNWKMALMVNYNRLEKNWAILYIFSLLFAHSLKQTNFFCLHLHACNNATNVSSFLFKNFLFVSRLTAVTFIMQSIFSFSITDTGNIEVFVSSSVQTRQARALPLPPQYLFCTLLLYLPLPRQLWSHGSVKRGLLLASHHSFSTFDWFCCW